MDLKFDFSALWTQVKRVTDELVPFKVEFTHHLDPIDVALSERGVDVVLDEIEDIGNLLSYKGRQILLYIPDHAGSVSNVLAGSAEGKKFHVAHCQTLEKMKEAKRFERYVATTKLDGYFTLTGADYLTGKEIRGDARLLVCKHCLSKLNYKQAALSPATRHKIRNDFDITEFFETYSSCFPYIPKRETPGAGSGLYSSNWREISDRVRADAQWQCDECKIGLADHKHLLHVHHIDGNKGNNTESNLRPLCAACHRDQPFHSTIFVRREDMLTITQLRVALGVLGRNWAALMKYSDTALRGYLGLARAKGSYPPQVGLTIGHLE